MTEDKVQQAQTDNAAIDVSAATEDFPFKEEKYVNLDFRPSDEFEITAESSEDESLVEQPAPTLAEDIRTPQDAEPPKPFVKAFFSQFKRQDSKKETKKETPSEEPQESTQVNETTTNEAPESVQEKEDPSSLTDNPEPEAKEKTIKKPRRSRKMIFRAVAAALLLVLIVGGGSILYQRLSPIREFSQKIDRSEFALASELYEKNKKNESFVSAADQTMREELDEIISEYAKNEIDATTAAAKLKEYQIFPSITQYYEKSMEKAASLEQSKNASVLGSQSIEQGNYLQGLESWTHVIALDSVNYEAIRKSIEENENLFISNGLLECSQYLSNNQLDYYQAGIKLLYYWFPSNKSIAKAYSAISSGDVSFVDPPNTSDPLFNGENNSEQNQPDKENNSSEQSTSPIVISKCSVSLPQSNGSIRLYIDWTNTSDRVIKEISFLVKAKDEFGNEMFCYKGDYSMFQAIATGPWAPGEGMNSKNSYWENAWYNSRITEVELLQVDITYSDGSSEQISEPNTLMLPDS